MLISIYIQGLFTLFKKFFSPFPHGTIHYRLYDIFLGLKSGMSIFKYCFLATSYFYSFMVIKSTGLSPFLFSFPI